MTKVIEDLLLDVRQYDPKTESILADAVEGGENRKAYIEKAIQFYALSNAPTSKKESAILEQIDASSGRKRGGRSKS